MSADPFETHDAAQEARLIRQLLDDLPIYATRIGFRYDATEDEHALGAALFKVHAAWLEERAS